MEKETRARSERSLWPRYLVFILTALFVLGCLGESAAATLADNPYPLPAGCLAVNPSGDPDTIHHLYFPRTVPEYCIPVVQQPEGDYGFVSDDPYSLTQYEFVKRDHVVWLLAHRQSGGPYFSESAIGDPVITINGDNKATYYLISGQVEYPAPEDPAVGNAIVQRLKKNRLVLQTCSGEDEENRLFLIGSLALAAP